MIPKVSVAVVTYQQRHFLEAAIESVLGQEFDDYEIVVADDASTDGSRELLESYASRSPGRFRLFFAEHNSGITMNTNRALLNCRGDYVALLPGDDMMLPGRLAKQAAWLDANRDASICYSNCEHFDDDRPEVHGLHHDPVTNPMRDADVHDLFRSMTFFSGTAVMARRACLPASGCDVRLPHVSDWLLWVETARKGRIGFVPETLARYRTHAAGASRKFDLMLADQLLALAIVEARYPELIEDARVMRSQVFWSHAMRLLSNGDIGGARRLLVGAFAQGRGVKFDGGSLRKWVYFLATKTDSIDLVVRARELRHRFLSRGVR